MVEKTWLRSTILIIIIALLLASIIPQPVFAAIKVGVKVGDEAVYDFLTADNSGEFKFKITGISRSKVTYNVTTTLDNGTIKNEARTINLNDDLWDLWIIPAELKSGSEVGGDLTITEIKSEFYLNYPRDVCIISKTSEQVNVFAVYDQACGIAYELNNGSLTLYLRRTTCNLSISLWFLVLIFLTPFTLAITIITVYFWKIRKRLPKYPPTILPPPPKAPKVPSPPVPPQLIYCMNCGAKLPKDSIFCPICGTRVKI